MNDTILGIESSTNIAYIYLIKNELLIDSFYSEEKNKHDELLAKKTSEILIQNKIEMSDISAIACSAGPGSFTGLRVGASFAKGLAFQNNTKIIPISFFELTLNLIENLENSSIIMPSHSDIYYFSNAQDYREGNKIFLKSKDEITRSKMNLYGIKNHDDIEIKNKLSPISMENLFKTAIRKFNDNKFINSINFKPNYHQQFQTK